MPRQPDWTEAVEHIKSNDKKMAMWIDRIGQPELRLRHQHTIFYSLLRSIIYQQLAGAAASAILARVDALCPEGQMTPEFLIAAPDELLRSAGLSKNKMAALRDLAAKTLDGTVPAARSIARMQDELVIEHCTQVRGIGRWTVEMLLMFRLGRPDVLPLDDYGIRKGFQIVYKMPDLPTKEQMIKRAERWRPWRTVGCWYMWRVVESVPRVKKKA